MGLFITHAKPTALMKKEAASAGVIDTPFGKFARLQILTINTVVHETFHAIWYASNLPEEADEEDVVTCLANGLQQVLRDNPEYAKWWVSAVCRLGEDSHK